VPVPAPVAPRVPALVPSDTRTEVEKYLDQVAPSTIAGQMVKFSKDGKYVIIETDEEVNPDRDFIALCDETLIGYIRFNEEGVQPTRVQGLLYGKNGSPGFVIPPRDSLGDMDSRNWADGLDGEPEDPWKHQMNLVLQEPATGALFTFSTTSDTGRRAVGRLLRHYDRMRWSSPDTYPVVRLKPSGFTSKRKGVGWVHTPSFAVVGRTPKNSSAIPDTSAGGDMNDEIPNL
jgi:hypothetical protein